MFHFDVSEERHSATEGKLKGVRCVEQEEAAGSNGAQCGGTAGGIRVCPKSTPSRIAICRVKASRQAKASRGRLQ